MTKNTTSHQEGSKCAKHVRFSSSSTLTTTRSKTKDDIAATWYTQMERRQFKREFRDSCMALSSTRTAKAMELSTVMFTSDISHLLDSAAGGENETPKDTAIRKKAFRFLHKKRFVNQENFRGLERHISLPLLRVAQEQKQTVVAEVLKEQERQREQLALREDFKRSMGAGDWDDDAEAANVCALRIAQVSRIHSRGSREWSRWVANLSE